MKKKRERLLLYPVQFHKVYLSLLGRWNIYIRIESIISG
jgi:hypothetical protein